MTKATVAIIGFGRPGAMGALSRVRQLREIFVAAGAEVVDLSLCSDFPWGWRDLARADVRSLAKGDIVPESMAWSLRDVHRELDRVAPDVIVTNTSRSFHPSFTTRGKVVLDYVDRLSVSYRDRSTVQTQPKRVLFQVLAPMAGRFERRDHGSRTRTIAAGWSDARDLGAEWIPLTVRPVDMPANAADLDCVFFGNLAYEPNAEAVERLGRVWPMVLKGRPGTSLVLAGANPSAAQYAMAHRLGWQIWPDFEDLEEMLSHFRLALAPLVHASGIQHKVLEAAASGVAQVISPIVAAGLDPSFPISIAPSDDRLAAQICELLDDPDARRKLAAESLAHIRSRYTTEYFIPWATSVIDG